ncbi:hypothetical protein TRFO_24500 [Tritrichomonas foetus]|uniref:Tyr recombinase domain-containing protein n=1 Tax=Tritrichomonas foetus TaxID=1144522 RepID=A0A1J4KCF8_9EUKA|nr:hypothetical protein TRFO_24500 [Tritrichomonas foetus]|eukprot:OHT07334.1 hypothetical protein TRFO_24500 [Tritrichomonas foetus]
MGFLVKCMENQESMLKSLYIPMTWFLFCALLTYLSKRIKIGFFMTVMFFGFLRISEALNLTRKDINLKQNDMIKVLIRNSKTDQEGKGQYVIIKDGGQAYSPFRYLEVLNSIDPDEKFFVNSAKQFNRIFRIHLTTIGLDANKYSSHSFRRGGA